MIWIYTVCKGRVCPVSAGLGLNVGWKNFSWSFIQGCLWHSLKMHKPCLLQILGTLDHKVPGLNLAQGKEFSSWLCGTSLHEAFPGFALGFFFFRHHFRQFDFFCAIFLTLSRILSQILAIFRQRIILSEKRCSFTDSFNCSNRFKSQYNVKCVGDLKLILTLIFKTSAVIN